MTSGLNAFLVDSNILVYAFDPRDARKQQAAAALLERLIDRQAAVLSVQCLSEFFNATTRKLPERLEPAEALRHVTRFTETCRILDLTLAVAVEGYRGAIRFKISIWDALIWATAKLNQVPYVLTEDLQHDSVLEGIRIQNPFVPEFDLGQLAQI